MKLRYSLLSLSVLAAGGVLWLTLASTPQGVVSRAVLNTPTSTAQSSASSLAPTLITQQPAQLTTVAKAPIAPFPPSFAGTEIDGRLAVDRNGHLVIEQPVRELFDYFLASIGEESIGTSIERLQGYIGTQLAEPARGEAKALLGQYLQYKSELVDLERRLPQISSLDGLRQREEATRTLRERVFTRDAHQAFFANEEQYNQFTLDRLAVQSDPELNDAGKAARLSQLRAELPEELQLAATIELQQELHRQTAALQERGGSSEELQTLRSQLVGEQAAGRLAQLDERRAQWQQRLGDYRQEQQRLAGRSELSEQARAQALTQYAQEHFSPTERLRLDGALSAQK